MSQKIIEGAFLVLLFFTPLFFTPFNNELFEYNKMLLTYGLTFIIAGFWLIKMVLERRVIFKKTPLDIPILLFLLSQTLSTFFSIDTHTSLWGYYSRSNGGLFSILSYLTLFYAFVSNISRGRLTLFLKAVLAGGLVVSLWAIPEHFGVSPSCVILVGRFSADCWVQDVQARVFATLGQPNWLAAYLSMLIFPAMYFFLSAKNRLLSTYYLVLTVILYLAFTFTYSRGSSLGFLAGILVFGASYIFNLRSKQAFSSIGIILGFFLTINLLFGSALTGDFRLIKQSAPPPRPGLTTGVTTSSTQLETGGTESGQIRLIVWKGAFDIFKHYPVLGSGVETFAYSYYNFRPKEHNLVSEWDFLYNKAHNEYINYLATTGILGLGSYLLMIGGFVVWSIRYQVLGMNKKIHDTNYLILNTALLSGYISYLIQNAFGFSVVMIALLFYLFPAFAFVEADVLNNRTFKGKFTGQFFSLFAGIIYKREIYTKGAVLIILLMTGYLLFSLGKIWTADKYYKLGSDYADAGNVGKGYNYLLSAYALNDSEPLFESDLGYAAAAASVALAEEDATESARLKDEAGQYTDEVLRSSPKNVSLWRTAIRTYYELSLIDPKFEDKTLETVDNTIALAPTDPKLYYNKALILFQLGKKVDAVEVMKKAIEFRPNYREAHLTLGGFYLELSEKDKARAEAEFVLKMIPNDPDALKLLEQIDNQKTQKDSAGQNL